MTKRMVAILAAAFTAVVLTMSVTGPAVAQEPPPGCVETPASPACTTTTTVLGTSTVPTTEAPTTTTTEASTTTTEASTTTETIEGVSSTPPTTQAAAPATVKGDVVSRPLPRTGNDIGGTALFGGVLTVLGVALALGARKRRNSFEGA